MNIKLLAQGAIDQLKEYKDFPKEGFIAGGSIANLIWEYVSGKKAAINDIDIFVFDGIIKTDYNFLGTDAQTRKKLSYVQKEVKYIEDYAGLSSTSENKEYYLINRTENKGIYNYIYYSASESSPQVIINSFDINCTQIGYSIDDDKFYWTEAFEDFLKTGELKLTNVLSPSHSAIRLVKKEDELGAKLDILELQLCQHCIGNRMIDTNRKCFTEKYAKIYRKYENTLKSHFRMHIDDQITRYFKEEKKIDLDIYTLDVPIIKNEIFESERLCRIYTSNKFLFYIRNIEGDKEKMEIWDKLHFIFGDENYVDAKIDKEDVDMLSRLLNTAPKTIENLKGLTLGKQISIMKNLFNIYKEDPIIAISVLEKIKFDIDKEFDEGDILLLELSVRKEIINDSKNKVDRVFGRVPVNRSRRGNQIDELLI